MDTLYQCRCLWKNDAHCYIVMIMTFFVCSCNKSNDQLFVQQKYSKTGIDFQNTLDLSGDLNILDFEYMYNGGGVAIADFDNDGLQDVFFTGNMVSNRLYRNLGDWQFEDVTESSQVTSFGWSNGVSVVDINQDGYLDIYVCRGGHRKSKITNCTNLLFINTGLDNGQLQFEEQAAEYGLADVSYSIQANFFDYDLDGDLDMYLLNNALVNYNRNTPREKVNDGTAISADKLYRNNGDQTFSDVSSEANILLEGFGLGVEVTDMNGDGWFDIYVSNDFLSEDILYMNQRDGTFKNEIRKAMKHLSFNGMGNDIADINNDGHMDIVVLDMLPPDNLRWKMTMTGNNYDSYMSRIESDYYYQYIRNTLQLNNGNGSFGEIGQLAGISATEWSWSPLLADFDHNGTTDLYITNGYRQDITNLDFMVYGNTIMSMGREKANDQKRLEALAELKGIKMTNFLFRNNGDLTFDDVSAQSGFTEPTYSNGAAYGDLDNDGDLDLVINNIDDYAGIFENKITEKEDQKYIRFTFQAKSPNRNGVGCKIELLYRGQMQTKYFTSCRGYLSSVEQALHFGLEREIDLIDTVMVTWPDGAVEILTDVKSNQELRISHTNAIEGQEIKDTLIPPLFNIADIEGVKNVHRENEFVDFKIQALLPHMHSKNGPGMAVGDANGDGLEDVFIGGAAGHAGVIKIQEGNSFKVEIEMPDAECEDMGAIFFDADGDGDQDLYVCSGGSSKEYGDDRYRDRLYSNNGEGQYEKIEGVNNQLISSSVVCASDYDKDGDLDLFVGGRICPGQYPKSPSSVLLENVSANGTIAFEEMTDSDYGFKNLGMVTAAMWTDFNNDSWQDLIVVGEFMSIKIFQNEGGKLRPLKDDASLTNTGGWWNSISSGDFDNDGDVDYILGNLGLNSRFKASEDEPFCVYAKDYDNNGLIDPILCHYVEGQSQIAHSRSDLISQINVMRGRFRNYSDYANASFEESFTKSDLAEATVLKCQTFASSYLENLGDGTFNLVHLPLDFQTAPIYGIISDDFNQDGNLDFIAVGNFYSTEVFGGRYDASIGWFAVGDGKGGFDYQDVKQSGFCVHGDAKSLVHIPRGDSILILAGINNGQNVCHTLKIDDRNIYKAKDADEALVIEYVNGSKRRVEFSYGSGYLSQSSRSVIIPKSAHKIKLINSQDGETEIQF